MKKTIKISEHAIMYDDGSLEIDCSSCGKRDKLDAEHPIAIRAGQIESFNSENYVCLSCWKGNKDKEKQLEKNTLNDKIAYAQAYNLAVAMLPENMKESTDKDALLEFIDLWQKHFYEQLKEKSK